LFCVNLLKKGLQRYVFLRKNIWSIIFFMKEDFLHYIWQNGFFDHLKLQTTSNEPLKIIRSGFHNPDAGPDFLQAQIKIGHVLWAGHVEIHKNASDWYAHGHEKDPAYDNVILHIVYDDDMPVYDIQNRQIPTLDISRYILKDIIKNYNKLIKNKTFIRCQNELAQVDAYVLFHYKYRLFLERLYNKNEQIKKQLLESQNNWKQIFYQTLLTYMGGPVNKESFALIGQLLPFGIFAKYQDRLLSLEALLFGVAGLLHESKYDHYYQRLQQEFLFLKNKHNLETLPAGAVKFHRLRPPNFPTLRLAQVARLFYQTDHLFEKLMQIEAVGEAYTLLHSTASTYWDTHYNFDKITKARKKAIGTSFIDILLINVVIPLKFAYQKYKGKINHDNILSLMEKIPPEKNKIINSFQRLKFPVNNALDTQAVIQLYQHYCHPFNCLSCDIGHKIIKKGLA